MKKRLQAVCACIRLDGQHQHHSLVDVGYDHGQILHWAQQHGIATVSGIETSDDFTRRYRQHYGDDGVTLYVGNALQALPDTHAADILIFSGLGEQQIRQMLQDSPMHFAHAKHIIFCPSSIDLQLRPFLNQQGWVVDVEYVVHEKKRSYMIASAIPAHTAAYSVVADPELAALMPQLCYDRDIDGREQYLKFVAKRFHYDPQEYVARINKKIASLS